MNSFINLPNDIKLYIQSFIFAYCQNCSQKHFFFHLKKNIVFYEYLSIFNDLWNDYYIYDQSSITFNIICNHCYDYYHHSLYIDGNMIQN